MSSRATTIESWLFQVQPVPHRATPQTSAPGTCLASYPPDISQRQTLSVCKNNHEIPAGDSSVCHVMQSCGWYYTGPGYLLSTYVIQAMTHPAVTIDVQAANGSFNAPVRVCVSM